MAIKNHRISGRGARREPIEKGNNIPISDGDGLWFTGAGGVRPRAWFLGLAMVLVGIAFVIGANMLMRSPAEAPLIAGSEVADRRNDLLPAEEAQRPVPSSPPHEIAAASDQWQENSPPAFDIEEELNQPPGTGPAPMETAAGSKDDAPEVEELTGIHVFPPLGTNPLLTGIIVPDDFDLPQGYVRHYQNTDDGRQLEPILMYHPVQPPLDWRGEPLLVPPDRVVTPDLAPKGLPINMLEVPEPEEPSNDLQGFLNEDQSGHR
ncbi:MAG: hypothetical protein C4548_09705 [Desulfobacteraceae bacterium]|jgi:hypothetical protein|nr:MAG: hypothetical protein C4548_09705 [Desulfobacteraceae bacterium]